MMIFSNLVSLIVVSFLLKDVLSDSGTYKELLKSSKEHYLFKPQFSIEGINFRESNAFSTLLSKIDGIHAPEFFVSFTVNSTRYLIQLELNKGLIPQGFSVAYLGGGKYGEDVFEKHSPAEINNCYYHGRIVGMEDSQVVASTCSGLKASIFLPHDLLQLSPVDDQNSMHALYRPNDIREHFCEDHPFDIFHKAITESEAIISPIRLKRATEEKKIIELLVVADNEEFKKFDNRLALNDHIKEVVNHVDALYKKLDMRVVLLHIEVWVGGDKIANDSRASNVLTEFLNYRKEKIMTSSPDSPWRYTDNAQLLHGIYLDGPVMGMATLSSMCSLHSGGVNEDNMNALQTAATVAHEMGHNLGISHDTDNCDCKFCVMAATRGDSHPNGWSDCSVKYLRKGFEHGTATCLFNVPDSKRLFGVPRCGNGIVEHGEQCDCGLPEECKSKCCNATTCQLLVEAKCDSGTCCTADCHFKNSSFVCRAVENDCDIMESCSGDFAHCPENIYKMDGIYCDSGVGVCYGGTCRTHEMQCKEIWGPSAQNANDYCYRVVNKKGNTNGNCGKDGIQFKKCSEKDSKCGKLLCVGGEEYPLIANDRIFFKNTFSDKDFVCRTLSSLSGSTDTDPGLVWEGTKCGDGKMCFNGMCSNISQVLKSCNADCHDHGICNNFGNCHCEAGWAPPDCSVKGNGGSVDSGSYASVADHYSTKGKGNADVEPTNAATVMMNEVSTKANGSIDVEPTNAATVLMNDVSRKGDASTEVPSDGGSEGRKREQSLPSGQISVNTAGTWVVIISVIPQIAFALVDLIRWSYCVGKQKDDVCGNKRGREKCAGGGMSSQPLPSSGSTRPLSPLTNERHPYAPSVDEDTPCGMKQTVTRTSPRFHVRPAPLITTKLPVLLTKADSTCSFPPSTRNE